MQKAKQIAEKYLPKPVVDRLGNIVIRLRAVGVFHYDRRRFNKHYSRSVNRSDKEQLRARLTFHAHSIEKGLSHDNIRYGFGKVALRKLAKVMKAYNRRGYDKADVIYVNALSIVKAYIKLHEDAGQPIPHIDELFDGLMEDVMTSPSEIGGAHTVVSSSKKSNKTKNFKELFLNRHSVREYSDKPVDRRLIESAVNIAMKTPTVCNRQPSRVRIIEDPEIIKKALRIQGGLNGYDTPPVLLAVTTDSRSFVARTERNQVYVDGGSFSMALMLGLEYEGLAACPLNTMFTIVQDRRMRRLLNFDSSENIIMLIAVGNFKKSSTTPKSYRIPGKQVIKAVI